MTGQRTTTKNQPANNGTTTRVPPHDHAAEQALLGALFMRRSAPERIDAALTIVDAADYSRPSYGHIHHACATLIARGEIAEPVTVHAHLEQQGLAQALGDNPLGQLLSIQTHDGFVPSNAPNYAQRIRDTARRRRLITLAEDLSNAAYQGDETAKPLAELAEVNSGTAFIEPGPTIDAFLDTPEPEYDWIVPGLIERGDRIILTGNEGHGKSTLLRQMTIQLGAGIHPFTLDDTTPVRVLYLDLENSTRQVRRKIRPLRLAAPKLDPDTITIRVRPQGLDLLHQHDVNLLDGLVAANQPDVLIIGPLYKMASGDPTSEEVARTVTAVIDNLRTKHQFAVIIEAHTPHSTPNNNRRPERPYGASLWLRWPEFGIYLAKEGNLRHWRGARDERHWPVLLTRGGDWPWTLDHDETSITFARCLEELRNAGRRLSYRDLATMTGGSKSQIQRMVNNNRDQWEAMCQTVDAERDLTDAGLFGDVPNPTLDELAQRRQQRDST